MTPTREDLDAGSGAGDGVERVGRHLDDLRQVPVLIGERRPHGDPDHLGVERVTVDPSDWQSTLDGELDLGVLGVIRAADDGDLQVGACGAVADSDPLALEEAVAEPARHVARNACEHDSAGGTVDLDRDRALVQTLAGETVDGDVRVAAGGERDRRVERHRLHRQRRDQSVDGGEADPNPNELTDEEALEEEVAEVAAVAAGQHEARHTEVDETVEHRRLAVDPDLVVVAGNDGYAVDRGDVGGAVGEDRDVDDGDGPLGQADRVVVIGTAEFDHGVAIGLDRVQPSCVVVDDLDVESSRLAAQVGHGTHAARLEVGRVVGGCARELDDDDLVFFLDTVLLGGDPDPNRDEPVGRVERDRHRRQVEARVKE